MSNVNTFAGWYGLPTVTAATTSAFTYKVPASGVYAGLPSPSQTAGNALVLSVQPGDISVGSVVDYGRPFRVRLNGVVTSNQSENITVALYQVSNAVASAGFTAATGTGQNAIATTGTIATGAALKFNFMLEAILTWDSTSGFLNGFYQGVTGAGTPRVLNSGAQTIIASSPASLTEKDLNFYFVLTAATNTAADVFGPIDFTADRY